MEIFLGSHHFLLIMKHTPPPLIFPASAVLSIRKTEKLSDGVTAVSGTEGVSHVSDKQRMLQSLTGLQTATKTVAFATKNIHLRVMFLLRSPLATI